MVSKMGKRGQSMSINVIIVAALALVVLVVLVVIFTSRTASFDQTVSKESQTELIKMKIQYGDCRPTVSQEGSFKTEFTAAQTDTDKEQARTTFTQEIKRCKEFTDKSLCESGSCLWG